MLELKKKWHWEFLSVHEEEQQQCLRQYVHRKWFYVRPERPDDTHMVSIEPKFTYRNKAYKHC